MTLMGMLKWKNLGVLNLRQRPVINIRMVRMGAVVFPRKSTLVGYATLSGPENIYI